MKTKLELLLSPVFSLSCSYLSAEQIIQLSKTSKSLMLLGNNNRLWFDRCKEKLPDLKFVPTSNFKEIYLKAIKKEVFAVSPVTNNDYAFFDNRMPVLDGCPAFTILKSDNPVNYSLFVQFKEHNHLYMVHIYLKPNNYLKVEYLTSSSAAAYLKFKFQTLNIAIDNKIFERIMSDILNTSVKTSMIDWIKSFIAGFNNPERNALVDRMFNDLNQEEKPSFCTIM